MSRYVKIALIFMILLAEVQSLSFSKQSERHRRKFQIDEDEDDELIEPEPAGKRMMSNVPNLRPSYTGGLRLTGGANNTYGIVEVSYNNVWGTICDDGMSFGKANTKRTPQVICDLLGFPTATTKARWFSFAGKKIAKGYTVRQSSVGKIWLDDFYCLGSETSIDKCVHKPPGVHNCLSSENIGVICKSTSRDHDASATTKQPSTTPNRPPSTRPTLPPIINPPKANTTSTTTVSSISGSTCGRSRYTSGSGLSPPGVAYVVGGVGAKPNQYPWIARLSIRTSSGYYVCGGTIVSRSHVLTAAHCIDGLTITGITAYLGDHNSVEVDNGEIAAQISTWTKHPFFNPNTYDYDFAILRLSQNLVFTNWTIQPICLPSSCDTGCTKAGSMVSIAGWGMTSFSGVSARPQYLQTANIPLGDFNTTCKIQYGRLMTDRMICAGYKNGGIDTCQGDSGGPLMSNENGYYKLCGVTSFGNGCALPNLFGVYSKVCSQLNWIKTNAGLA